MTGDDFKNPSGTSRHDRVIDWLGAQGPSALTIYMCAIVALVAFVVDKMAEPGSPKLYAISMRRAISDLEFLRDDA